MQLRYTYRVNKNSSRLRFSRVLRQSTGIVTLDDFCRALKIDRAQASKTAARWVAQGRLTRIRPGLFAPVPLDSEPETSSISDPWQLVPELFGASFVTGWSAAEHWDLTEQIFRRICVKTTGQLRKNIVSVRDGEFFVTHVSKDLLFGTDVRWADRVRVAVADPHRTIVDMLDDPRLGGGGRHTADCVRSYLLSRFSAVETIITYAERIGNGAVFKRLGFLAEHLVGAENQIIEACRQRLTAGYADFDPAVKDGRIITRWRVRVPETVLADLTS